MRTAIARLSFIGSLASSAILWLVPLIALTSLYFQHGVQPVVDLQLKDLQIKLGSEDRFVRKAVPIAHFHVSLDADFTPLFHWNTKQLYVYLALEYPSKTYPRNEIVIWDRLITRNDKPRLIVRNLKNKYNVADIDQKFLGEAKVKLYWNIMPFTGILFWDQKGEIIVDFDKINAKK